MQNDKIHSQNKCIHFDWNQEELKHFDHKIAKHKHYQEQADESRKMMQEGHVHLREKHEKFQKKADEHGRWVSSEQCDSNNDMFLMIKWWLWLF